MQVTKARIAELKALLKKDDDAFDKITAMRKEELEGLKKHNLN